MNSERYLKLKKDFIVLYLARNGIITCLVTLFAFGLDLSQYYQISFYSAILRIFSNSIFTVMYFLLMWVFNYLLFEFFKIMSDHYRLKKGILTMDINHHQYYIPWVIFVILLVFSTIIMMIDIPRLFHYNCVMMFIFMVLKAIKDIYKKRL